MQVITREIFDVGYGGSIRIVPLGDVHIGAAACDEARLKRAVEYIGADPSTYWIGMGDFCDFINRSDPRFHPQTLAPWIGMADFGDLAKAQINHFLEVVKPIAPKCLALVEGNHETALSKHYERDVYGSIVSGIKEMGGFPADYRLAIGYYGWLRLRLFFGAKAAVKEHSQVVDFNLHHGFSGGKLAGGKALNLQRWMWTHNADVSLMGHSHNTEIQVEAVEEINKAGNVTTRKRIGAFTGTFLRTAQEGGNTYAEVKGYLPLPMAGVEIVLTPFRDNVMDRIHVTTAV